jgi:hypothetical protein
LKRHPHLNGFDRSVQRVEHGADGDQGDRDYRQRRPDMVDALAEAVHFALEFANFAIEFALEFANLAINSFNTATWLYT